jgi:chromosome segregation ATPase
MRELDRRVGILRLLLADIADRERQAEDARKQLRGQIQRIVDFTVQFNGGVSNALAGMAEVEDRLTRQDAALRHLALLRERARAELHAVLVTGEVADSRRRLAELEAQRTRLVADASDSVAPQPDATVGLAEIDAEIASLRAAIEAASDDAARSLAGGDASKPSLNSSRGP